MEGDPMTTNNYILARWRDASTDPPDDGYYLLSGEGERKDGLWCSHIGGHWIDDSSMMPVELQPGDQWLDITDEPAVPRAAVQAAVDRLFEAEYLADCECPTCDAIRELADALGVTPTEVTP